jgi:hypothetical protein
MKNINTSKGAMKSGMTGPLRSPMAGNMANEKTKLNPSIAANTTMPGISRRSAPIQSPMNGGKIVRYGKYKDGGGM